MRCKLVGCTTLALACLFHPHPGGAQDAAEPVASDSQRIAPFQVFDNLYYVGARDVSAWLLESDQGLILFDSMNHERVDYAIDGIRELGFDPDDIRYLIVSHAHPYHVGGARRLQQEFGVVVLMTEADWRITETEPESLAYPPPMRHLSPGNGDNLNLGRTRVQFLHTPGRTAGGLSTVFTVYDSGYPHTAILFGAGEPEFGEPDRLRAFIDAVDRLRAMSDVEVHVPIRPDAGDVFARLEGLQQRRDGDPHPFVDPESWQAGLDLLRREAQARLDSEAN